MDLTFDGQGVGAHGGLASNSVMRLTCIRSRVSVARHIDNILGRFDRDHCAI